ncbi:MAG: hypothetical protein QM796_15975 [Chthoniobacteraceae bacterium]
MRYLLKLPLITIFLCSCLIALASFVIPGRSMKAAAQIYITSATFYPSEWSPKHLTEVYQAARQDLHADTAIEGFTETEHPFFVVRVFASSQAAAHELAEKMAAGIFQHSSDKSLLSPIYRDVGSALTPGQSSILRLFDWLGGNAAIIALLSLGLSFARPSLQAPPPLRTTTATARNDDPY